MLVSRIVKSNGDEMRWILAGWTMFILSAVFFIAAAWRAGDMLALLGGLLFLFACFSFVYPIIRRITWSGRINRLS